MRTRKLMKRRKNTRINNIKKRKYKRNNTNKKKSRKNKQKGGNDIMLRNKSMNNQSMNSQSMNNRSMNTQSNTNYTNNTNNNIEKKSTGKQLVNDIQSGLTRSYKRVTGTHPREHFNRLKKGLSSIFYNVGYQTSRLGE